MEVYRQIINIKNNTLNLLLPDKFKNRKVEVIVLSVEEKEKQKKHKPSDFRGCLSKDIATVMLQQINDSRNEWQRDF